MIDTNSIGDIVYDVEDHVAITPNTNADYCLVPKVVEQNVILKLQKIMMDIGNYNVEKDNCQSYEVIMRFINNHPVVEMYLNKED